MKIVFAQQKLERSIFLAGPTPRDPNVESWRPLAIKILEDFNFDGTVFVPEQPDFKSFANYDAQVEWEWEALNQATVIAFWVPRNVETLPGFTTNIEYGLHIASSKIVLGFPDDAEKMTYMAKLAKRYNIPVYHTLRDLLDVCRDKAAEPFGEF